MERIDSTPYYDYHAETLHSKRLTDASVASDLAPFLHELKPSSRVLDWGCGTGVDLLYIENAGHAAVGIEVAPRMFDLAKKVASRSTVINKNGLFYTPLPNEFDGVWINESLNLLPFEQAQRVVATCFNGMKPGGILGLIVLEGSSCYEDRAGDLMGPSRTVYLYNEKPICSMIEQTGFEMIKVGRQPGKLLVLAKKISAL